MSAPIYLTKTELAAFLVPQAPAGGAYRLVTTAAGTFLELKDSATGQYGALTLANGVLTTRQQSA